MKKILLLTLIFSFYTGFSQEHIRQFHSDIQVDTTGIITVTESIEIYATGHVFKRGLVREFPKYRKDKDNKKVKVNYTIRSITHNGKKSPYLRDDTSSKMVLKIGSAQVFIPTGVHKYTITYQVNGQIGFFKNYDEIYWNVTGNEWRIPIQQAKATVFLPLEAEVQTSSCYTGKYGSSASNCTSKLINPNQILFRTAQLGLNEGLTVAVSFPKDIVTEPPPPPPPTFFEKFGLIISAVVLFLGLLIYYVWSWIKHGIDPPKPIVYPQYEAPHNLSPAAVGMYHKERYWEGLISSSIVNLAIKGYIKITDTAQKGLFGFKKKTFTLEKLNPKPNSLSKEEKRLMRDLFKKNKVLEIDGTYDKTIATALKNYGRTLKQKHIENINSGNNTRFLIIPILSIIGFIVFALFFNKDDLSKIKDVILGGLSIFYILIFVFVIRKVFKIDKIHAGKTISVIALVIIIGLVALVVYFKDSLSLDSYVSLTFIVLSVLSLFIYRVLIKKPTVEKLQIQSLIEGYIMYIKAAEKDRIQFHNSPKMTPHHFEKVLPYAIALDVDDIWGERFNSLFSQSSQGQTYQPTWYEGPSTFRPNFGHTLQSSLGNSISRSSIKPSSSSGGSWSSGSSGGGFSGGGGGGGGGGGW